MRDWNPAVPAKSRCSRKHMYFCTCTCLKFVNEHLNDSEENWGKVLWSDETKIELAGINSTHCIWRRRNAAYDPKNTSPLSNMEVETLCFGAVFLLRGQNNCTASKGRWNVPSGPVHWKCVVDGSRPAWKWPKTHGQGNKEVDQEEEHWDPGVAYPVSRP